MTIHNNLLIRSQLAFAIKTASLND